jgi:hypothetical protein
MKLRMPGIGKEEAVKYEPGCWRMQLGFAGGGRYSCDAVDRHGGRLAPGRVFSDAPRQHDVGSRMNWWQWRMAQTKRFCPGTWRLVHKSRYP